MPLLFTCNKVRFSRVIEMVLLSIHRIYTIDLAEGLGFVIKERDTQLNKQRSR